MGLDWHRDMYGFAVQPQHLQRYRKHANIYKVLLKSSNLILGLGFCFGVNRGLLALWASIFGQHCDIPHGGIGRRRRRLRDQSGGRRFCERWTKKNWELS